jgi:hypothetical protein
MLKGRDEIGVRGSISSSVLNKTPGGPGGVSEPAAACVCSAAGIKPSAPKATIHAKTNGLLITVLSGFECLKLNTVTNLRS